MARMVHWRSLANLALQLAVLLLLVAAMLFVRMPLVSGASMSPDITSGEYVLINTFAYRFSSPARGDIVAFRTDRDARGPFIKRVVGLPGDRITIERGVVSVDGIALHEPYVRYPDTRSFPPAVVPPGDVYVLGDNRADSEDSRFFGPVPAAQLIGRAVAGIWPPADIGRL